MQFKEIVAQEEAKQQLLQMVNMGRLPHALLLIGQEGCGQLALALALAQYVLCQQRTENEPCGTCQACIKSSKWIHPDIHFSFPTIGTNSKSDQFLEQWRTLLGDHPYFSAFDWLQHIGAENKQGNINKEECLNVFKKLSLKTFESEYKVLIMWMPEYLGKEGNRLLKLIEEPTENTFFILVAERAELILNTILSRCQLVKLNLLNDNTIIKALEKRGVPNAKASKIALLTNGNFNEAIKLSKQADNDNSLLFLDWMRKCYKGNGIEMVNWVERFASMGREHQKFFLQYALHFMREYLYFFMTNDLAQLRLAEAEQQTAVKFKAIINFEQVEKIVNLLNDLTFHIERNASPKLLLLDASLQINKLLKNKRD